jgi:2'-5' RNA ligase
MRCFTAIEFDDGTRAFLAKLQDSLRAAGIKGNYTAEANFHLTLKFLGEVDHRIISRMEPLLARVAANFEPFVLSLDRLGKFDKGRGFIVWCGLVPDKRLNALQRHVQRELEAEFPQFKDRSGFSPHITLIREAAFGSSPSSWPEAGTIPAGERFDNLFASLRKPELQFTAGGLSLMESTRVEGKLRYVRKQFHRFMR